MSILSLGHSTHSAERFVEICRDAGIDTILDVRSHPTSRWPQWAGVDNIREWLGDAGVRYEWWPEVGGWDVRHSSYLDAMAPRGVDLAPYLRGKFPKQRIAAKVRAPDPGPDAFELRPAEKYPPIEYGGNPDWTSTWHSQGLHDYAWYTSTPEFLRGCDRLIRTHAHTDGRAAMICCEACWWKCHRSMIADVLYSRGIEVQHVMPRARGVAVTAHPGAGRQSHYPAEVRRAWDSLPA